MSLKTWIESFVIGAAAAVSGSLRAVTDQNLNQAFWKSAKTLFIWSSVLVLLVHAIFLPLEWILSWLLPQNWIDMTLRAARYAMGSTIPFVIVTASRYLNVELFENAFFAGLRDRDPALAQRISKKEAIYWDWEYFYHAILLGVRQGVFGLLVVVISPVLGVLIPIFRFGYKTRRMESFFWMPVVIAFCIPFTRPLAVKIVRIWINSRELTRELYDPVIARLKTFKVYDPKSPDYSYEWHTDRSDAARLGFCMVIGFFLELPFVGPFAWFAAFVAAGLMTPELLNTDGFKA